MSIPLRMDTKAEMIRMAARTGPARLQMQGTSMLPDLHEGMLLDVSAREPRPGDIVVFRCGSRILAHRAIRVSECELTCSGDAYPLYAERVPRNAVLGVVTAVFDESGRRVDGTLFRLRGLLRMRLRHIRALACLSLPQLRARTYRALVHAMSAAVRDDAQTLRTVVRAQPPLALAAMAKRHRCAAALCRALDSVRDDHHAASLWTLLRTQRWQAALRRDPLADQVGEIVNLLARCGLQPILLKGAHRAVCGFSEAELYDSCDIDVMVPEPAVYRACAQLRAAGYSQQDAGERYEHHHHAPPLVRPGALPVEVHRALYCAQFGFPNTYADLEPYTRTIDIHGTCVRVLDAAATALHLAVHCLQRPALRELALLALQLRRMDEYDRNSLRGLLEREERYAIPIAGALVFAARLAGIEWAAPAQAQRYADWMLVREDLPRPLRARIAYADARLSGAPRQPSDAARNALYALSAAAISVYVKFMR